MSGIEDLRLEPTLTDQPEGSEHMAWQDETWVITGASRGIGAALARAFSARGASLVLNGRRVETLEAVAGSLAGAVRCVAGDISVAETSQRIAAVAEGLGGVTGVVHNAAVAAPGPRIWELPEADARAVLGASLDGGLPLVRALVPGMMRRGGGCMVFVGSGVAVRNLEGVGAYCVAKAAEEHLARQLDLEAPGLSSFVWRPGVVDTDMQAEARVAEGGASAVVRRRFRSFQEEGMLISPEEAAEDLLRRLGGDRVALGGGTWQVGWP